MDARSEMGFADPGAGFQPGPSADGPDRLARLRLIRSRRVGPVTFRRLLAEHGTATAALAALPEIARAAKVSDYTVYPTDTALAEMKAAKRAGAQMLCLGDATYPGALAEIADAPPVLWALGDTGLLARPALAMVGTRNASSLGGRMTRRLAADLGAAGYVLVSGLARGIDALAHEAALGTGTIAVQAGGLDVPYPVENTALSDRIGAAGLRLSEQPFGLTPQARHFPRRNRIVSGLAQAVIVIEAAARSGSLITARQALDQGREVLAVPGHPMDSRASGCNLLIRDGATLVRNADDVLEHLQPAPSPPQAAAAAAPKPPPRPMPDHAQTSARILTQLGPAPTAEDQLIRDLRLPPAAVAQAVAALELAGRIERHPGGLLIRAG